MKLADYRPSSLTIPYIVCVYCPSTTASLKSAIAQFASGGKLFYCITMVTVRYLHLTTLTDIDYMPAWHPLVWLLLTQKGPA